MYPELCFQCNYSSLCTRDCITPENFFWNCSVFKFVENQLPEWVFISLSLFPYLGTCRVPSVGEIAFLLPYPIDLQPSGIKTSKHRKACARKHLSRGRGKLFESRGRDLRLRAEVSLSTLAGSVVKSWLGRLFRRCFQNLSLSKAKTLTVRKSWDNNLKASRSCPGNADRQANIAIPAQHLFLFCLKLIRGCPAARFQSFFSGSAHSNLLALRVCPLLDFPQLLLSFENLFKR